MQAPCPCGSLLAYTACCGRFIDGHALPTTPLELMRSRYTAYTQSQIDYIARTTSGKALKQLDIKASKAWAHAIKWDYLEIIDSTQTGDKGFVEFRAYFFQNNKQHVLHELSEFHLKDGQWFYVDGREPQKQPIKKEKNPKIGRNDACTCKSGKKYKKCCGMVKMK